MAEAEQAEKNLVASAVKSNGPVLEHRPFSFRGEIDFVQLVAGSRGFVG